MTGISRTKGWLMLPLIFAKRWIKQEEVNHVGRPWALKSWPSYCEKPVLLEPKSSGEYCISWLSYLGRICLGLSAHNWASCLLLSDYMIMRFPVVKQLHKEIWPVSIGFKGFFSPTASLRFKKVEFRSAQGRCIFPSIRCKFFKATE